MNCEVLGYKDLGRFEAEFYRPNRPVVLRGLAETNRFKVFRWSAEYFQDVFDRQQVPVIETRSGYLSYERDVTLMPYREFVARSFGPRRRTDVRYYFKNSADLIPPDHNDADAIEVLSPYIKRSFLRNLWISPGGLTVGLHFDHADNLNFQLRGEKTFTLFPPGVRAYYPMPMFSQTAHISRVYREGPSPDLTRYPRFDPSVGIRVDLVEGDILYVPAYWWHMVESSGVQNVNLNFWWLPPARKQIRNWNQALRGYYQLLSRYLSLGSITKAPPSRKALAD